MSDPLFSSMSGSVENCDQLLVGSKGIYIGDYKGGEGVGGLCRTREEMSSFFNLQSN